MIRYDDVERVMTASVRDLVAAGAPTGHLAPVVVQRRATRAAQGRQVHLDWQARQASRTEGYRAEVSLKHQVAIDDWTAVILGRADGLHEEDGHVIVEEIKSTALDASRLYATSLDDWPMFVAQLEIYLWMLARGHHADPIGRLVLISVADGSQHLLGVPFDLDRITAIVHDRLTALIESRKARLAWYSHRRSRTVVVPHAAWRPGQIEIAQAVQWGLEAKLAVLVEAPTGLGKTAAALHGALIEALGRDKQIFWATARSTQQVGVARALDHLRTAGLDLRSVQIVAKERACLHEVVSCRPDICPYAEHYYDKVAEASLLPTLARSESHLGPVALADAGQTHQVCPFELSLDLSSDVDVVIGDYNYVFDPAVHLRRHFDEATARGWVVVTDEVHQLPERARSYHSPFIEVSLIADAIAHLRSAGPRFAAFVDLARSIEDAVAHEVTRASGRRNRNEHVCDPDAETWRHLGERIDATGLDYALLVADAAAPWPASTDPWVHLARRVLRLADGLANDHEALVAVARRGAAGGFGLLCLDPAPWLGPQIARLGGFVGLSATLRPAAFHLAQLGIDPDKADVVEVPNPFPPERRRVVIAPRISTTYADRVEHAPATAALMAACIEAVPGNVAVYFPSFAMLDDITGRWTLPDRRLILQRRGMAQASRRALLDTLTDGGSPVVLAAVLGGIYAEGIDLPPGALAAVLVAGPALPPVGLERDLLRDYHEAHHGAGFLYASLVPGLTRVVQAAGRLIRRPEDRGVIVLFGRRFRWRDISALLPDAFDPTVADDPAAEVAAFFAAYADSSAPSPPPGGEPEPPTR